MLNTLIIITVIGQAINLGIINIKGEVNRGLMVAVYTGYMAIEGYLAVTVTWTLWLFVLLNLWVIISAAYGWWESL